MINPDVLKGQGQYDWIAGGNSPIVRKVLNPSLDWKPYHLEHEIQFINSNKPYDTEFCVSFSANKIIGALFMYYLKNNLIAPEGVKWLQDNGYFLDGIINFNERFTAINGQTTAQGAYQYKVANGIKNNGLIPQPMFPYATDFQDNIDPKFITQAMKDLGKEFLKRFQINYEWAPDTSWLQYSPLQGIVRYADYVNPTDILAPQGDINHAIEVVFKTDTYDEIDDSYYQIYKRYAPNYVESLLSYNLTINNLITMDIQSFLKTNDQKWVRNTNTGAFGRVLQDKLFLLPTTDRATLALLDDKVRTNGVQITDEEWKQLSSVNF